MATAARAVYSHITKQAGVRAGKACIDHTRIAVADIVALLKAGQTPDGMRVASFANSRPDSRRDLVLLRERRRGRGHLR